MNALSRGLGFGGASSPRHSRGQAEIRPDLIGTVEPAVGPIRIGLVMKINATSGLAYVQETKTLRRFKLSRKFVDAQVFDALRRGVQVRFRENGHNAVAAVSLDR